MERGSGAGQRGRLLLGRAWRQKYPGRWGGDKPRSILLGCKDESTSRKKKGLRECARTKKRRMAKLR